MQVIGKFSFVEGCFDKGYLMQLIWVLPSILDRIKTFTPIFSLFVSVCACVDYLLISGR